MTRLNQIISVFVLSVFCVICFSGCMKSENLATDAYSQPGSSSSEFQNKSEPAPTAKTLYAVANIMASQGREAEYEAVMKRIISENPDFFPAYNSLAESQMRQGRTNDAIETIHTGLRVRPKDTVLLNNLGMCWLVRMEYENALEMFAKAAGIMPENTRYRANMAVALSLMERNEESLALFKQILREDQASHNMKLIQEIAKSAENVSTKK